MKIIYLQLCGRVRDVHCYLSTQLDGYLYKVEKEAPAAEERAEGETVTTKIGERQLQMHAEGKGNYNLAMYIASYSR